MNWGRKVQKLPVKLILDIVPGGSWSKLFYTLEDRTLYFTEYHPSGVSIGQFNQSLKLQEPGEKLISVPIKFWNVFNDVINCLVFMRSGQIC